MTRYMIRVAYHRFRTGFLLFLLDVVLRSRMHRRAKARVMMYSIFVTFFLLLYLSYCFSYIYIVSYNFFSLLSFSSLWYINKITHFFFFFLLQCKLCVCVVTNNHATKRVRLNTQRQQSPTYLGVISVHITMPRDEQRQKGHTAARIAHHLETHNAKRRIASRGAPSFNNHISPHMGDQNPPTLAHIVLKT